MKKPKNSTNKEVNMAVFEDGFIKYMSITLGEEMNMEDKFIKYPSIENSYNQKFIEKCLFIHPEINDIQYHVSEKLDGSNIQILFSPDGKYKIGRRNDWLKETDKFHNIPLDSLRHIDIFSIFKNLSLRHQKPIRVFFELIGNSINKRVKYNIENNNDNKLYIIDIMLEERFISPAEVYGFTFFGDSKEVIIPVDYFCPRIAITNNLQDALSISNTFGSRVINSPSNTAEGTIIKPLNEVIYFGDHRFIIKNKSPAFSERPAPKERPINENMNEQRLFNGYINENRIISCFSKIGEIQSKDEISKYIKYIIDDCKDDFAKDHPEIDISNSEIYKKSGGHIFNYLKRHIP